MGEDTYVQRFDEIARCQAVIAGIETHVCVLQTAFDLIERGHDTFVVADAVTSRTPLNRQTALDRMKEAGVTIVTTEMVVFEWLRIAGTPEFKELSALVR
ncbi:MAG: isochorismatase family protein [Rhodospirillales bacterium]|jgi:nicotinamidase-related amidase|nr:isochorismatase family protein [Rhodospirillales bacterium]